jgi:DNA polymerase theta
LKLNTFRCLLVKRSDEDEGNGIKRALLEIIASGVATTPADVQRYASCTFYVSSKEQEDGESTNNIIATTVGYLEKNEFITLKKKEDASTKVYNKICLQCSLHVLAMAAKLNHILN